MELQNSIKINNFSLVIRKISLPIIHCQYIFKKYLWKKVVTNWCWWVTKYILQWDRKKQCLAKYLRKKKNFFEKTFKASPFRARKKVLYAFKNNIFPLKVIVDDPKEKSPTTLKIQTKKINIRKLTKLLQRLIIALTQVKTGNTNKYLLNEIYQILYSLYCAKEITKKVYNYIINSIKV